MNGNERGPVGSAPGPGWAEYPDVKTALEDAILDSVGELTGEANRVIPGIEIPEFVVDRIAAGKPSGMSEGPLRTAALSGGNDVTTFIRPSAHGGTGRARTFYLNPEIEPERSLPAR